MSAAHIVLEDVDGAIACKLTFSGGFDPKSHAHQHAQILVGMMDKLCDPNGPLPEIPAVAVAGLPVVQG